MKKDFSKSYYEFKMKISFRIFSAYFQDKEELKNFLSQFSNEKQEKFFRLSKFYDDIVQGQFFKDKNVKTFFSLIMIFSLIEATVSEGKHKDLDQYLIENFKPIDDKEELKQKIDEYFNKFGIRRQVKKFFEEYVDEECKKIFANAICVNSGNKQKTLSKDKNIQKNIDLFYDWRSKLVHNAEIPIAFQDSRFCVIKKNNTTAYIITTAYTEEDFKILFEHGFLRYFGYKKDFEHKDTEEKIERYKKYCSTVVLKNILNNKRIENLKKISNEFRNLIKN